MATIIATSNNSGIEYQNQTVITNLGERPSMLRIKLKSDLDGSEVLISNAHIDIYDFGGTKIAEGTYLSQDEFLEFSFPQNQTYKIVCQTPIKINNVVYFYPHSNNMSGTLTTDRTVVISYSNVSNLTTIQAVKEFIKLKNVTLEEKQAVLVSNETNSFTFDCELTDPDTNTKYVMPFRILKVSDNMVKKVNGVDVQFTGALVQSAYTLVSRPFDDREQVKASGTFESGLYYYWGTSASLSDQAFTALTKGTDYQVGDSISTWEVNNTGKYVYKHSFAPGSGNTSTMQMMRYGSNIYQWSNIHKWLNGKDKNWFTASYVGDTLASSYQDKYGFKNWWKAEDIACIEDNVAYGVYNRSGYELENNKIYCQFTLPSVTELAGSGNNFEGTVSDYWLWKNGGVVSNGANANRVMQYVTSKTSNQYVWIRSPYRSYSSGSWYLGTSGSLYATNCFNSFGVSPLFII